MVEAPCGNSESNFEADTIIDCNLYNRKLGIELKDFLHVERVNSSIIYFIESGKTLVYSIYFSSSIGT